MAGMTGSWGWRVGPWIADDPGLAAALLDGLRRDRPGPVLVDAPQRNASAGRLLEQRGFRPVGRTVRMYRGTPPSLPIGDLYGLACLELG
jgi:ribosomal-protein-alanine N-acetyltransferase